jgi:putative transposase
LVVVTKYRRHVFTLAHLAALRALFWRICTDFEAELVEFDGRVKTL